MILDGIKKRLEKAKAGGLKSCPMCCRLITPLRGGLIEKRRSLCAFGTQAIIPLEIGLPTLKSKVFDMGHNDIMLALDLTLIEECRNCALACMAWYQQ